MFPARMKALTSAAERYFQKCPSQLHEGAFAGLVKDAIDLVQKRNQIAHGIVYSMTSFIKGSDGEDRFAQDTPWFRHGMALFT